MQVSSNVVAELCRHEESLGRRWRLWPWRLWFAIDHMGIPVERPLGPPPAPTVFEARRQRVYFFRRECRGGSTHEVRHKSFRVAARSIARPAVRPMRQRPRGRAALVFAVLYASISLLHAVLDADPFMAAVWMALACAWFDTFRRHRAES